MQERKFNGEDILTNKASLEDFCKAMTNVENKLVALHKPESDVMLSDGTKYKVNKNGSWIKIK